MVSNMPIDLKLRVQIPEIKLPTIDLEITKKIEMKKVIIWGHKQGHTHSWVHASFHKAFKHLGYDTYWFDDADMHTGILEKFDFADSLFLTEGQVDSELPVRGDCKYILHNCNLKKYESTLKNCLNLQVYSTPRTSDSNVEKVDDFTYYQPEPSHHDGCDNRTLFMPWATNLLPHEFPERTISMVREARTREVHWVGSVTDGYQGNGIELVKLDSSLKELGVDIQVSRVDDETHMDLVMKSYVAPAVQGAWQVDVGYIPCRVFKNVSYGKIPFTNSPTVDALFEGRIPYAPTADMKELIQKTVWLEETISEEKYQELINFVKTKHTYLNRIELLLRFV